jgi:hypothetical protein
LCIEAKEFKRLIECYVTRTNVLSVIGLLCTVIETFVGLRSGAIGIKKAVGVGIYQPLWITRVISCARPTV